MTTLLQVLPEYDLRMAQTGALVISYRARYVKALAQEAARYHREFSGDSESLELTYRTEDNTEERPWMLHRAIFGSIERFLGILIEHYAGALPLWLENNQWIIHDGWLRNDGPMTLRLDKDTADALVAEGFDAAQVERVLSTVRATAFKRALEPPYPQAPFYA